MPAVQYFSMVTLLEDFKKHPGVKREIFDHRHAVTGVLYYADGHFFQCLEGNELILELLVEKLSKDSRHREIMIYGFKSIDQAHFADWSMKYVSRIVMRFSVSE